MKFVVDSVSKCSGRLGTLSGMERMPNLSIKTPLLLQTTRGGSVPYLSREILEMTTDLRQLVLAFNLSTTVEMLESCRSSGKGFSSFVALSECLTFLGFKDTSEETKSGHHEKAGMPLFTRHGKKVISPEIFMDFVETFRPDFFHLLSDGDTTVASSKKRGIQSVSRTMDFVRKCLEIREKSENLRKIFTLAPIVGGFSHANRRKCLEFAKEAAAQVDGYFLDGLHANGETAILASDKEILEMVKFCVENLPREKLKMIPGAFTPLLLLKMVQLGVDVFDNTLPHLYTVKNRALVFDFQGKEASGRRILSIDLTEQKFREEFEPVLDGCECLTCMNYTKAYLFHLIDCQELLGKILLNIHNFHHYRLFFSHIHHHIAADTLPNLISAIEEQSSEENFEEIFPPRASVIKSSSKPTSPANETLSEAEDSEEVNQEAQK